MEVRTSLVLALMAVSTLALDGAHVVLPPRPKRCSYLRTHGMLGADCSGLNLSGVPANLRVDIEVLDLSTNRLRELSVAALSRLTNLRFLYLADNLIMGVDAEALASLKRLEVLDLSLNALREAPVGMLELPGLRRLYLADNPLDPEPWDVAARSSVSFLSLARCRLTTLPPLEVFPEVRELNLSDNKLNTLSPEQLAPLCHLQSVELAGNPLEGGCPCRTLRGWLDARRVTAIGAGISCSDGLSAEAAAACDNSSAAGRQAALEITETCIADAISSEQRRSLQHASMWVGITAACLLLSGAVGLFWWRKKRLKQRHKNRADRVQPVETLLDTGK